jgi:hypothetical protein
VWAPAGGESKSRRTAGEGRWAARGIFPWWAEFGYKARLAGFWFILFFSFFFFPFSNPIEFKFEFKLDGSSFTLYLYS